MKMDFPPQLPDVLTEASNWVAKIERGLTSSEERQLKLWLSGSPDRVETLMELAAIWDRSESLSQLAALFPQGFEKSPRARKYPPLVAVAAILVVAIVQLWKPVYWEIGGLGTAPFNGRVELAETYRTPIGRHSQVDLSDGSTITLNTDTVVQVLFSKDQRTVNLQKGEVFVEVAHEDSWPFLVEAGGHILEAVGTAFNVRMDSADDVELIVAEGRVHVEESSTVHETKKRLRFRQGGSSSTSRERPLYVSAGEQVVLSDGRGYIRPAPVAEIAVKLSWRSGNLSFRGELLSDALREVERYTEERFVIGNEELNETRIVGHVKAGDVDGLLFALRENFNIAHQRNAAGRIVLVPKSE